MWSGTDHDKAPRGVGWKTCLNVKRFRVKLFIDLALYKSTWIDWLFGWKLGNEVDQSSIPVVNQV